MALLNACVVFLAVFGRELNYVLNEEQRCDYRAERFFKRHEEEAVCERCEELLPWVAMEVLSFILNESRYGGVECHFSRAFMS